MAATEAPIKARATRRCNDIGPLPGSRIGAGGEYARAVAAHNNRKATVAAQKGPPVRLQGPFARQNAPFSAATRELFNKCSVHLSERELWSAGLRRRTFMNKTIRWFTGAVALLAAT